MSKWIAGLALALATVGAGAQTATSSGEVVKVDKPAARLTLKHDGVKNLDMPPMAMIFAVADPKLLDDLEVGNKVRFAAERVGGRYTVTVLIKQP